MSRTLASTSTLLPLLIGLLYCPRASAQAIVINYTDRGWYSEVGFHIPSNLNYFVGDSRGVGCSTNCHSDVHNFFVFDLTGVTQSITSARLAVYVPSATAGGDRGGGFSSPGDDSENYELHDVVTPIASLLDGTGGVAAHSDLGSGVVYGSRTMTSADMGSVVEIELNSSAIAALDAATGLIGIGGSLTTLDITANNELVFAFSNFDTEITQLRLTLVPEPSTLLLLGVGAISLLGYRKAKSHR